MSLSLNWTPYKREYRATRAKELGLVYVAKYAGSLYSADGVNGPYFKFDLVKWDFVPVA